MNVSLWIAIIWAICFARTIMSCFQIASNQNRSSRIELPDGFDASPGAVLAVSILIILIYDMPMYLYFIASSVLVKNIFFTLFTISLVIPRLYMISDVFKIYKELVHKKDMIIDDDPLSFTILLGVHLAYFGYYIFTGTLFGIQ